MSVSVVTGVTGVVLAWSLAGAQWWRARRMVSGISPLSWAVFLNLNVTWAIYAVGVSNPYLLANGIGAAVLNAALLSRLDVQRLRTLALVVTGSGLAAVVGVTVGWQPVVIWCVAMAIFLRWPQVVRLVTDPDVGGVSLTTWIVAAVNNIVWVVVAVQAGDGWLTGVNVVLTVSSLVLVGLCLWRR